MTIHEALEMGPLRLAYVGDSVYDLLVRSDLLHTGKKLHALHKDATARVKACAQAETLKKIGPFLTEEEEEIVRKGRNARSRHSAPRSATCAEYSASTGFEAMLGYLYLTGRQDRIAELYLLAHR